ncbi:unnamed protein product [Cunninghamella echinulata]
MIELPNEILFIIFHYIKLESSIREYGYVCKLWYKLIHHPSFYDTIHIHNYSHFISFIHWASKTTFKKKPMGYFIKHITISFQDPILQPHDMIQLQQLCPFLLTIDYQPMPSNNNHHHYNNNKNHMTYPILSFWKHLIHIPVWHDEPLSTCIQSLGPQLEFLHTFISPSLSTSPLQLFPFLNTSILFTNLKELYLDFRSFDRHHHHNDDESIFMNQDTLDIIHQKCPVLKKLKIQHIHLIYDPFLTITAASSSSGIQPHNGLTTLELENLYILDPEFFCYLFKKYPNLLYFKMIFNEKDPISSQATDTKWILQDTIQYGFPHLITCDILFSNKN